MWEETTTSKKRTRKQSEETDIKVESSKDDGSGKPHNQDSKESKKPEEHEESTNEESVLNLCQTISEYPTRPNVYFANRQTEIALAPNVMAELRALFSRSHSYFFPKELIDLCFAYYLETEKVIIPRRIKQLYHYRYQKRILTNLTQSQKKMIKMADGRAPKYLWWFRMKSILPPFVPLGDVKLKVSKDGRHQLLDENGKRIAALYYWLHPRFGSNNYDDDMKTRFIWQSSVPMIELVAPYLNTSTVTLDQLKASALVLKARTNHSEETWLSRLFELFKVLSAFQLWISEEETFKGMEFADSKCAQWKSAKKWNEFHDKYHFGERVPWFRSQFL